METFNTIVYWYLQIGLWLFVFTAVGAAIKNNLTPLDVIKLFFSKIITNPIVLLRILILSVILILTLPALFIISLFIFIKNIKDTPQ